MMLSPIELEEHLEDAHAYCSEYIESLDAVALRELHSNEHAGNNQVGHDHA